MMRTVGALLSWVWLVGLVDPVAADPLLLEKFKADPFRRADVDGCAVCHADPDGAGELNEFGAAFEAAGQSITPLMRAEFPDLFGFFSTRLADGSVFYFSDPDSEFVVFERDEQRILIDLVTIAEEVIPRARNSLSFFVTSEGPGRGGHLEGLAGADHHCQSLADAVGAGERIWRAYLSTSFQGQPTVNAGDRIGTGPWYNAKGSLVARGVTDLHRGNRLTKETAVDENGERINGRGDDPNRHDILTGSLPDGTAAVDMTCNNWTSDAEGTAMVGHHDREGGGENGNSWNSAHPSTSCSQEDLRATGGDGLFYCFAID